MKLNYKLQGAGKPMILLHGLFGSLDNLGVIARAFAEHYQVIQVDLRNHGLSPWSNEMNYELMANDVIELMDFLQLSDAIFVGHSMGGKVAMYLAEQYVNRVDQLIVLDIAPANYAADSHQAVFCGIKRCFDEQIVGRQAIANVLQSYVSTSVAQFILKSYKADKWLFNFPALFHHYADIRGWQEVGCCFQPVLFIKGENSHYINAENHSDIIQQFPYASIEIALNCGHNVHLENPQQVIQLISHWLSA